MIVSFNGEQKEHIKEKQVACKKKRIADSSAEVDQKTKIKKEADVKSVPGKKTKIKKEKYSLEITVTTQGFRRIPDHGCWSSGSTYAWAPREGLLVDFNNPYETEWLARYTVSFLNC